jgi:hypothetical protein
MIKPEVAPFTTPHYPAWSATLAAYQDRIAVERAAAVAHRAQARLADERADAIRAEALAWAEGAA